MANTAESDHHGLSDVAYSDGGILSVDIRMAVFRRVPFGAVWQVLRTVHGRCIIQLSPAGGPLCQLSLCHTQAQSRTHPSHMTAVAQVPNTTPPDRSTRTTGAVETPTCIVKQETNHQRNFSTSDYGKEMTGIAEDMISK